MTEARKKAYSELVAYVLREFTPVTLGTDPIYASEVMEEFYALVYRVDPDCRHLYASEFPGVLL